MKLPPEMRRAVDRLSGALLDSNDPESIAPAAIDLLSEIRRFEKKLEETTKDVGVSTHALARVR